MLRWTASRHARAAALLALPAAFAVVPLAAFGAAAGTAVMLPAWFHVVFVSLAGALALGAAVALSVAARRRDDGRAVLLGFAFAIMAALLLLHALATPGVLVGDNGLVRLAGALNLPAGAVVLAASALPALRRPRRVDLLLRLEVGVVSVLLVAGGVVLLDPAVVPALPEQGSPAALAVLVGGGVAFLVLALRAARTYLLTRRLADLLVVAGAVSLLGALYGLLEVPMMELGFWVAHAFEVAGLGLVGVPAALDLRHDVPSRPLVGDLRATELVAHEETYLGGRVRALMVRLAREDASTEGHTRRVATLAVELGEQLGLPERRLRLLALGGLLHDMGKLSVPSEVLTKPGRLDPEERAVIERHPTWGRELLAELGGFHPLVLDLVERHHERVDGAGYPGRLPALELPLEVRLLTVADVFDALTADRVYRAAWPADRALALLDEERGTAFDPACVAALHVVLAERARRGERLQHEPAAGAAGLRLATA